MEIEARLEGPRPRFVAIEQGEVIGLIDVTPAGERVFDLSHTEVNPEHEGKGYGRALVHAAGNWAREHGHRLRASCPYADKLLRRDPLLNALLTDAV